RTVIDRRQRKKPTGLRAVFRLLCQPPQLWRIKITAQSAKPCVSSFAQPAKRKCTRGGNGVELTSSDSSIIIALVLGILIEGDIDANPDARRLHAPSQAQGR